MDYLLGRNAMDQSYLTGYGERPLMNPHHRFWAFQLDASTPTPPPGVISGGPNTGFEDPYIQGILPTNTAPQKAFLDHIESWSTNEITINWNSPFAWASDSPTKSEAVKHSQEVSLSSKLVCRATASLNSVLLILKLPTQMLAQENSTDFINTKRL